MVPPSKISTKLKEMQINYDLFQAQHRQKMHTHYLVFLGGSSHSVKAVVSTGQFGEEKHMSWQFVLQLQFVLWEYLTSFPEITAFWFRTPKAGLEPRALPGTGWSTAGRFRQVPVPTQEQWGTSSRLLLESHQVCRNLLLVTLAGCAQMFKPQHCIHSTASLKLV